LELPGLASADIFGTESHRMYKQIFVSQIWDFLNLEGLIPVFISPRMIVMQLHTQALARSYHLSYRLRLDIDIIPFLRFTNYLVGRNISDDSFAGIWSAHFMKNAVFLDMVPCGSCMCRHFGATHRLHNQGAKIQRARNNVSSASVASYW
jgi:hypothetical protein